MFEDTTNEIVLNELDQGETSELAVRLHAPFLADLLHDVHQLNETLYEGCIRRYLSNLLTKGELKVKSPYISRYELALSSYITRDKLCILRFECNPSFLLVISDLGRGFPISSIVLLKTGTLLHLTSTPWVITLSRLKNIDRSMMFSALSPLPRKVSLVVGDANFAHHAWNQLSAVDVLIRTYAHSRVDKIIATHEPLGPLQVLFPELKDNLVIRVPDSRLELENTPASLVVPVGSRVITRALSKRISAYASTHNDVGRHMHIKQRPTLWMSVRTRSRTPTNQVELLTTVGRAFLDAFPTGRLVIDGHSLPMDFPDGDVYDTRAVQCTVNNDRELAAKVIRLIGAEIDRRLEDILINAVGLPIIASIHLASIATFYFCHHGTTQHKIGWFTSCPGIVHGNRRVIMSRPEGWVKAQSAIASQPTYIDENLVSDVESDLPDAKTHSLYAENYTVLSCQTVADLVVSKAAEKVSPHLG